MTRFASVLIVFFLVVFAACSIFAEEQAPPELIEYIHNELVNLGSEQILIRAVKKANAEGKTLQEIKSLDEQWKAAHGITDYMSALMESECGRYLQRIKSEAGSLYAEIFVMDNQGALVAMTDKTSDYWQGDEAKFQNSFDAGRGAVFVDDVEFDDSTQSYLVQASFPVKDGSKVIGAVTVGIDIGEFEAR